MSAPRLSEAEVRSTAEAFVEIDLAMSEPQERPRAIMLVGQEGAGVAALSSELSEDLRIRGGYVEASDERLRFDVSYFVEQDEHNDSLLKATAADANRLSREVINLAVEARRNLVIESPSSSPEASLQLATELKQAGYNVEIHASAVNDQISYERATHRYEADRTDGEPAHYVPQDQHDRNFQNASDTVRRLEYAGAVDRVVVYNRLNDAIVNLEPTAGRSVAGEAFDRAREQLTDYERISLAQKWDEIGESMDRRAAPQEERDRVQHRMERAHYTLRSSKAAAESYDYRNPTEAANSRDLADRYGAKLEHAFREGDRRQVTQFPELRGAFAAEAGANRAAEQRSVPLPAFQDRIRENIATGLREGQVPTVRIRDTQVAEATRAASEAVR